MGERRAAPGHRRGRAHACAAEEDTTDTRAGPPGRKTRHREVGKMCRGRRGRKSSSQWRSHGGRRAGVDLRAEEEAWVCPVSASREGEELTMGGGIRGASVRLRADGEAPAPVVGSADGGGSNGGGHGERMKRIRMVERGRG
jgi:hypothetical protein